MYKNSLKTIVVFVTELHTEYQNILCKNIAYRASKMYIIFIFFIFTLCKFNNYTFNLVYNVILTQYQDLLSLYKITVESTEKNLAGIDSETLKAFIDLKNADSGECFIQIQFDGVDAGMIKSAPHSGGLDPMALCNYLSIALPLIQKYST